MSLVLIILALLYLPIGVALNLANEKTEPKYRRHRRRRY